MLVSEATIIFETIGIWIALLSVFVFKTVKGNLKLYLSILISFIGLILIARPSSIFGGYELSTQNNRSWGILLSFLSSFFGTAYYILLKNI
jgi:drug/metabolite transporter (DMT)-like permease